jgi:hypothetical protein
VIGKIGGRGADDEVTEYVAETKIVGMCDRLGDQSGERGGRDADTGGHAACPENHATSKHADADVS